MCWNVCWRCGSDPCIWKKFVLFESKIAKENVFAGVAVQTKQTQRCQKKASLNKPNIQFTIPETPFILHAVGALYTWDNWNSSTMKLLIIERNVWLHSEFNFKTSDNFLSYCPPIHFTFKQARPFLWEQ